MKKAKLRTEKISVRFYEGDIAKLAAYFPSIGYNRAIRQMLRSFLKGIDEKVAQKMGASAKSTMDISLEEIERDAADE